MATKLPSGYSWKASCPDCGCQQTPDNSKTKEVDGQIAFGSRCRSCTTRRLREWREAHRERWLAANRRNSANMRDKHKERVFAHYGDTCACCGEDRQEFLTIDHIDGGGSEHRSQKGMSGGSTIHAWLIKNGFPDGFQVLCWNCNASKGMLGYCPHEYEQEVGELVGFEGLAMTLDHH